MREAYLHGQYAALEKLAFNLNDARKMLSATKKHFLPKPGVRQARKDITQVLNKGSTPGAVDAQTQAYANTPKFFQSAKRNKAMQRSVNNTLGEVEKRIGLNQTAPKPLEGRKGVLVPKRAPQEHRQQRILDNIRDAHGSDNRTAMQRLKSQYSADQRQSYIYPGQGNVSKQLRDYSNATGSPYHVPKLEPKQEIMLNAVARGHEADELRVIPQMAMSRQGHRSPDVILREHNKLVTMPEGYEPVKNLMKDLRDAGETGLLQDYLRYGEGERLSRHARKRITDMLEQDMIKDTADALSMM